MSHTKRKPKSRPPTKTSPPPKGALQKGISNFMKRIKPPKVGGRNVGR